MAKIVRDMAPSPVSQYGNRQVLSIARAKHNPDLVTLQLAGLPTNTTPLYVARMNKNAKPQVVLFKGHDISLSNPISSANIHNMSWNTDLFVDGQPINMVYSQLSGNMTVHHPTLGDWRWKENKLTGSSWDLTDAQGAQLARIKIGGLTLKEKELELMIPCDEGVLDLVVMTAMVVKAINEATRDVVSETLGAAN
jgi:hypothetical protein